MNAQVGPISEMNGNRVANLSCDDRKSIRAAAAVAATSSVGTVVPWSTSSGAQGNVLTLTPWRKSMLKDHREVYCQAVMVNVTGGTLIAGTATADDFCELPSGLASTEAEALVMPVAN